MFSTILRIDENVIHIDKCELVKSLEHVPHDALKDRRSVLQPKGENSPLEVASSSDSNRYHKRCDSDTRFLHGNLIVPLFEINLAVKLCSVEPRQQLINPRQGGGIVVRLFIDFSIVKYQTQRAILLLDVGYRGCPRGHGGSYPPLVKIFLDLSS